MTLSSKKKFFFLRITEKGNCIDKDVKIGDIQVKHNELGIVWAQCPLSAAVRIAKLEKVRLGWITIKIGLLKARQQQCFKY